MKKEKTLRQIENRVDKIWIDDNIKFQKYYETATNTKKAEQTRENAKNRLIKRLAEYDLTFEEYGRYMDKIAEEFVRWYLK